LTDGWEEMMIKVKSGSYLANKKQTMFTFWFQILTAFWVIAEVDATVKVAIVVGYAGTTADEDCTEEDKIGYHQNASTALSLKLLSENEVQKIAQYDQNISNLGMEVGRISFEMLDISTSIG